MAADWGMVQVVIGLGVLAFVMPLHWAILLRRAFLILWVKHRPGDGECEYLSYAEMMRNPRARVHHCIGSCSHSFMQHRTVDVCWQATVSDFFNAQSFKRKTIAKPSNRLPLQQKFLCVDRKVLYAFILCTIPPSFEPGTFEIERPENKFEFEGCGLEIDIPEAGNRSDLRIIHVAFNPTPSVPIPYGHMLTAHEIKCLLQHYPPYYRQTLSYDHRPIPSPIQSIADVKRGGWVVAVGLTSCRPIPVYMDILNDPVDERGAVFWRSIRRVKAIIQNNILPLFQDPGEVNDIAATLQALDYVLRQKTDSGLSAIVARSRLIDPEMLPGPKLTVDQCKQAIQVFNDPPHLDPENLNRLHETLSPMLLHVLCGAYWGAFLCVTYVKNPGRELNRILPEAFMNGEKFYLKGC